MAENTADKVEREQAEAERAEQDRQDQVEQDMGADEFVVVAPYVTLKVKDQAGSFVIRGFHEGGRVKHDDIEEASLRHHLDSGLMAPVDSDAARFAGPAGTPKPGEPPNVPLTETPVTSLQLDERLRRQAEAADKAPEDATRGGRPRVNAPKEDWVNHAVAQRPEGQSEEDARAEAEAMSKADLVTKHSS